MDASSNRSGTLHTSSPNNYRDLCRKTMMLGVAETAKPNRKRQWKSKSASLKRKRTEFHPESLEINTMVKKSPACFPSTLSLGATRADEAESGQEFRGSQASTSSLHHKVAQRPGAGPALGERWESDSGFSSEASPPVSGRSSPSLCPSPALLVSLDCEMVGTGPRGRCSELARCSILDYSGSVLYDKYISPCQPVTDYRTRWSGIQRHHLLKAVPFAEAREEILCMLEGKVIVGHSIYNDFKALDMCHPCHMVRDVGSSRHVRKLAGFPHNRCLSLKILASKLLDRSIQSGRKGHCSVEDALAALHIYKLVENEMESELWSKTSKSEELPQPGPVSIDHYMQDQYWPEHLTDDGQ
ncbi:apoptosis-enhancing nuclease [Gadus chalcogrammus]|uniref:apoptosis-enhancing nuclease n=1 Tax=Gadus chalcogrammus TaxID=1042646 RepID=UPI0024C4AC5E|nr:apoptosis-enhancing nuclease [Gadus chalcogrammus]